MNFAQQIELNSQSTIPKTEQKKEPLSRIVFQIYDTIKTRTIGSRREEIRSYLQCESKGFWSEEWNYRASSTV